MVKLKDVEDIIIDEVSKSQETSMIIEAGILTEKLV